MREICPSCGKDMVMTTEAFEINGDAVRGIPHLLCRSCGEATFTPEQLDMVFGYRTAQKQLKADANDNREAIMYITQSAEIASLERDLAAANKKIEEQDAEIEKRYAEIEELKAKYEKLQAETAFEGDEPHGYPKPTDPKDVKARIVGEVDGHGRTVLPAEEYCEEDDVYDELYPEPLASEAEACDFADAAARNVIDDRRVNQSPFS